MKCQSCGKKEATVRYIEKINGQKQEMYFCIECAKKLGFVDFSNMFSPIFTNIPNVFNELEENLKCKLCGYTFDDYTNTGMFGCPKCYETFSNRLDDIFLKLHGKNRHIDLRDKKSQINSNKKEESNKHEYTLSKQEEILQLKDKLKELVEQEEYEKAAIIRDKIKVLERKN